MSYEEDRANLLAARETIARLTIPVTEEAAARGETWKAAILYMGSRYTAHYLTADEAESALEDDHIVERMQAPDGTDLDCHTFEPL